MAGRIQDLAKENWIQVTFAICYIIASLVLGIVPLAMSDPAASDSNQMNGIYMLINLAGTLLAFGIGLVMPTKLTKELSMLVIYQLIVPFSALPLQVKQTSRDRLHGFTSLHVFRAAVAQCFDMCITYMIMKFFSGLGVFAYGFVNVMTLYTYTSVFRDYYVFPEILNNGAGTTNDIGPLVNVATFIAIAMLALAARASFGKSDATHEQITRYVILAVSMTVGVAGIQSKLSFPTQKPAPLTPEDKSGYTVIAVAVPTIVLTLFLTLLVGTIVDLKNKVNTGKYPKSS